jgi:hypothetical protein
MDQTKHAKMDEDTVPATLLDAMIVCGKWDEIQQAYGVKFKEHVTHDLRKNKIERKAYPIETRSAVTEEQKELAAKATFEGLFSAETDYAGYFYQEMYDTETIAFDVKKARLEYEEGTYQESYPDDFGQVAQVPEDVKECLLHELRKDLHYMNKGKRILYTIVGAREASSAAGCIAIGYHGESGRVVQFRDHEEFACLKPKGPITWTPPTDMPVVSLREHRKVKNVKEYTKSGTMIRVNPGDAPTSEYLERMWWIMLFGYYFECHYMFNDKVNPYVCAHV